MSFDNTIADESTAGLFIANRLSENPSITAAVIEPGNDVCDDIGTLDVDLAGASSSPSPDWNFNSTVQPQLGDRVIAHYAGKALGGTIMWSLVLTM
ncbi:hypothetical protein SLS62_001320 [Diatrype stigma]|uniref:Uncharacterized protein n=1 Tax=Diatrype stigma TaxID=117547 RepID=A0AAN9YTD8_9PEZI